jgi:arsenate reductase (thioredoxin)
MATTLFACVESAGRSQIAAAWFNQLCDPRKAKAISAGTRPAQRVHPVVVEVMQEVGIDLSCVTPQLLTADLASGATLLVTMGCGDACPFVPGLKKIDWQVPDPKDQPIQLVREIRNEIRQRVSQLAAERNWL